MATHLPTGSSNVYLDYLLKRVSALRLERRRGGKAAVAASLLALFYVGAVLKQAKRPVVTCRRTSQNLRMLRALAAVIDRPYYPSWLTPNGHVNCALGFLKRGPRLRKSREIIRTWGEFPYFQKVHQITVNNTPCSQAVLVCFPGSISR